MTEKKKILMVDDEESILKLGSKILSKEGYNITTMTDSQKAIKHLSVNKFDLVITDLNMPKADGIKVITKVKECNHDTPCILCSGATDDILTTMPYEFLSKPFTYNTLVSTVKKLLDN